MSERRGAILCGVGAGTLFALSLPLTAALMGDSGVLLVAGLLLGGASIALTLARAVRADLGNEAPLRRRELATLATMTVTGGIAAPVLLIIGLSRAPSEVSTLLVNLRLPATLLMAWVLFRQPNRWPRYGAMAAIVAGAVVVLVGPHEAVPDRAGALAILGACVAWGIERSLAPRLSVHDPVRIAQAKASAAALPLLILAFAHGDIAPSVGATIGLLLVGAVGFGLSTTLALRSRRALGGDGDEAVAALGPFLGTAFAVLVLEAAWTVNLIVGGLLMAIGVILLIVGTPALHRAGHRPNARRSTA